MTCLKALREAAMVEVNRELKIAFTQAADNLMVVLKATYMDPTDYNMRTLNGYWAFATRILKAATPVVPPTTPTSSVNTLPCEKALAKERKAA